MVNSLRSCQVRVATGAMTQTAFNDMQKAFGINYNEFTVLFDPVLRLAMPALQIMRTDWMHGEIQHGSYSVEVGKFLHACQRKVSRRLDWQFWREVILLRTHAASPCCAVPASCLCAGCGRTAIRIEKLCMVFAVALLLTYFFNKCSCG